MPDTNSSGSGGEVQVTLPWPNKTLSPNARVHWAKKAAATKAARTEATWLIRARGKQRGWSAGAAYVTMVFCPPDHRRRDLDNLIASMKASNDGIADALGVDDSRFISTYSMGQPVKGGAVFVTIRGTA
jgi:crossover junction endodeoxyribonuclease RusA